METPVTIEPTAERVDTPDTPSVLPAALSPAPDVEVVPLTEVLRQIRVDSRLEPERYLDETAVPYGGD